MIAVHIAVQEADRDGFNLDVGQFHGQFTQGPFVKLQQYRAVRRDPLRHRKAPIPRDQRFRPFHVQIVLFKAMFVGDLDGVAKTVRGHQGGARALALDQSICGERCAMNGQGNVGGVDAGPLQNPLHAFQDGDFRCLRRGQQFQLIQTATMFQNHIGERAADIDSQPRSVSHPYSTLRSKP